MNATPICVWLVEDEPAYRDAVGFVLGHAEGFVCGETFRTAEAALAALNAAARLPDVLLLDYHLPGMDGLDLLRHLRRYGPDVRVVMLTNSEDDELIYAAFSAGASGYLLKNAPVQKLLAAVEETHGGGMLMPPAVARRVLREFRRAEVPDYGLTAREREVLALMTEGLTQPEIAGRLFLSTSTVNGYVQTVYGKLHVRTSSAAVGKALRERLV